MAALSAPKGLCFDREAPPLVHHFQGVKEMWGLGRRRSCLRAVEVYSQGL